MLTPDFPECVAAASHPVLVLGDGLLDVWLNGVSRRLCREAPVPVVDVTGRSSACGGAANTAVNLAALGADVTLVSVLGDDPEAGVLRGMLSSAGVRGAGLITDPRRLTPVKQRLVAGGALVARYDIVPEQGPSARAAQHTVDVFRAALRADPATAVVIVDHGLRTLPPELVDELRRVRDELSLLVVDAHELAPWAELRPDVVTPNLAEAARLLERPVPDGDRLGALVRYRDELLTAAGAAAMVLTADRDGSLLLTADPAAGVHRTWAEPAPELQAAGAGDCFVAALTLGTIGGLELPGAVELAQAAADVAVRRPGTSRCSTAALADRLRQHRAAALDDTELTRVVAEHRGAGRRIVFTNGCFDVLHRGHVAYLNQAKRLGDVLVVAVNDDHGVRRLKGADRPVNSVRDRVAVLAALSCVDHVAVFGQNTPARLIDLVRPDYYVKGGDYTPEMLPETELVRSYGGQVMMLDYLPDRSTTRIVNRIRAGTVGGRDG